MVMTVMSLIGMGKQKQKRLQTAMVILFLASLSFMVGYWNGLIPNAGYTLMEESKKGLLKTSNIKGRVRISTLKSWALT